jgi:hypothetical protein
VEETQALIEDNIQKRWEAAKGEKETIAALIATNERALDDLAHIARDAMDELAGLAADYAGLSLAESFSATLEKLIRLLKMRYKAIKKKGVGLEHLEEMRYSMEERLNVLRDASEGNSNLLREIRVVARRGGRRWLQVWSPPWLQAWTQAKAVVVEGEETVPFLRPWAEVWTRPQPESTAEAEARVLAWAWGTAG